MKKKIQIRAASLQDLPILKGFEQGIIEFERPFDPTIADDISYYDIEDMIKRKHTEVIVATIDNQLIGSGYADIRKAKHYLDHETYAYLGFMFVNKDFRGQGVNKLIIDKLKEWSQSKGINELRLDVYDDNPNAIKAYEKSGFKRHLVNMRLRLD